MTRTILVRVISTDRYRIPLKCEVASNVKQFYGRYLWPWLIPDGKRLTNWRQQKKYGLNFKSHCLIRDHHQFWPTLKLTTCGRASAVGPFLPMRCERFFTTCQCSVYWTQQLYQRSRISTSCITSCFSRVYTARDQSSRDRLFQSISWRFRQQALQCLDYYSMWCSLFFA